MCLHQNGGFMKKQKLWKRLMAMVLVSVMTVATAACGNSEEVDADSKTPQEGTQTTNKEQEVKQDTEKDLSWLNVSGDIAGLPLVEEGTEKTLSMYVKMRSGSGEPEDTWFYQFIEEAMNINLEITKYTDENKDEILSLAFASNELPDLIINGDFTTGDLLKYGANEGQLLDMAPYLNETYMPNLTAIYELDPSLKSSIVDTEGRIWSFGFVTAPNGNQNVARVFLNYDWLEECNVKIPETLDEFTEAMRAFKAMDSNNIPVGGSYASENPMLYILNAFGYLTNDATGLSVTLRNGEVVLPVADKAAYGEFLKYMNMLYEEELIHPDFFTMDTTTTQAVMTEGRNGFYSQAPFVYLDSFAEWWGALPLTSEYNDTAQWPVSEKATSIGQVVVTNACEEPELAAAFIDFFYNTVFLKHFYEKFFTSYVNIGSIEVVHSRFIGCQNLLFRLFKLNLP